MVANVPVRKSSSGIPEANLWQQEYGLKMLRYAQARLSDQQLAENAVQDTFVAALSHLNQFRGESEFVTWLFSILRRKIVDTHRATALHRRALSIWEQRQSFATVTQGNQMELLLQRESDEELRNAIEQLPDRYAQAIRLYYFESLSCDLIAGKLEISTANVWITLHRARARMLKLLPQN